MQSARLGSLALAFALTLGAATGSLGCKKLFKKKGANDAGATATAAGTPQDDADEQMQDKIDAYIICLNSLSSPVHSSRSRYFSWVNPKTGVTGNERTVLGITALPKDGAEKCNAGVAKAKGMPPADAKLETAGADFATSVAELDAIIDELVVYYENKNFRDDKFAKGKATHPRLVAAFSKFSRADNQLHATLDAITKPLALRSLARIEREEGKKFRYHRKAVLLSARELVEAGDPIGEDDDIDFQLYNASFAEYDKTLTELQAFGAANKKDLEAQTNAHWPLASSNFDQFSRVAEEYRKKSREYMRCLRDAPARAKGPTGKVDPDKMPVCADGRPRDVVAKYNEFIRTSNERQFP